MRYARSDLGASTLGSSKHDLPPAQVPKDSLGSRRCVRTRRQAARGTTSRRRDRAGGGSPDTWRRVLQWTSSCAAHSSRMPRGVPGTIEPHHHAHPRSHARSGRWFPHPCIAAVQAGLVASVPVAGAAAMQGEAPATPGATQVSVGKSAPRAGGVSEPSGRPAGGDIGRRGTPSPPLRRVQPAPLRRQRSGCPCRRRCVSARCRRLLPGVRVELSQCGRRLQEGAGLASPLAPSHCFLAGASSPSARLPTAHFSWTGEGLASRLEVPRSGMPVRGCRAPGRAAPVPGTWRPGPESGAIFPEPGKQGPGAGWASRPGRWGLEPSRGAGARGSGSGARARGHCMDLQDAPTISFVDPF